MAGSIRTKLAQIQFWGSSKNPTWQGTAFETNCCPCNCFVFADNFNRADSTDVGAAWHEEDGDWAISGFCLVEPSNTLARIYGTGPVPADSGGEMHMSVDVLNPATNDIYYLYIACTDEHGAGGEWAKFTYLGSSEWRVLLSTGETKDQTFPDVAGHTPLWACIDSDGFLMAGVAGSVHEFPWSSDGATALGRYYGIGHGVVADGAVFDNFSVEELRNGTVLCRLCFCHCQGHHLPKVLRLSVVDGESRASTMTGVVDMHWEWNSGLYRWVSDVLTIEDVPFKWALGCGTADPDHPFNHLGLYWYIADPDIYRSCCAANPGGCGGLHLPIEGSSTCSPLSLRYGPFTLSWGEFTCEVVGDSSLLGTYYIGITE